MVQADAQTVPTGPTHSPVLEPSVATFTFGPFSFEASTGRLSRDGVEVRMRAQAGRVLGALLEHRGRPLGYRAADVPRPGRGTFVSRHTVDVTVGEVRRILGEYGPGSCTGRGSATASTSRALKSWFARAGTSSTAGRRKARNARSASSRRRPSSTRATAGRWKASPPAYLMLATFGMAPPLEVYPRFLEAHEGAVQSGGLTPELRCNRALGLHMFEHRPHAAEAESSRPCATSRLRHRACPHGPDVRDAGRPGPRPAPSGRLCRGSSASDPSIDGCQRARWRGELDRRLPSAAAPSSCIPTCTSAGPTTRRPWRSPDAGGGAGAIPARVDDRGDLPWVRASKPRASPGWRVHGSSRDPRRTRTPAGHRVPATRCTWPCFRNALGERERRTQELERAFEENSAFLHTIDVDPKMAPFRGEPRFERVRTALRLRWKADAAAGVAIAAAMTASAAGSGRPGRRRVTSVLAAIRSRTGR